MLRDGEIAERGKHDHLVAMGGLYSSMWNAQLKSNEEIANAVASEMQA